LKCTKSKLPPTRQNDRNLSECKLLEAAQQLFMKLGFDASTTRMIAAQAGVNLALISKYFGNKEGLLLSLIERRKHEMLHCSLGYPEQPDFVGEVRAFYSYLLDIHALVGSLMMKIVISKSLTDESFNCQVKERLAIENRPLLERLLKFQKSGALRSDVDVHQIEEQIRSYYQAQAFFGSILYGDSKENILKKLHLFAETLGKAYARSV